jgi:predicted N-formylglutamate amidohydrolase
VENVVDALAEFGRLYGVNVTVIEKRQDLLAKYGGIAAVQFLGAATTA